MKLESAPLWPKNFFAKGIPTSLVTNCTPSGVYEVARVLSPGGPTEGDFQILFSGTQQQCDDFLRQQVETDFPGLL